MTIRSADAFVSLVLPVRNEAGYLERALDAIDEQTYPRELMEVIAVDGGSTDRTIELIKQRMTTDSRLNLLGGPGVNTPMAMRLGAKAARGGVIVKVDGHGWINRDFVQVAVGALAEDAGIGCVGGLIKPVATNATQSAISIARFSRLGVGGGVYTLAPRVQETDTVQCGAYRRAALDEAGGFDPAMAFGEDEELNYRVRLAGWRILLHPGMTFSYHVRPTIPSLFRQYFRYGRARVAVVRKHPSFFRPKHAIPATLVAGLAATAALFPVRGVQVIPAIAWGGYFAALAAGAVALAIRRRFARPDLVAASLLALHFGYGLGTLRGILDRPERSGESSPERIESPTGVGTRRDDARHEPHGEKGEG
jgi:succinoglycan biosynthesis protein ExoA